MKFIDRCPNCISSTTEESDEVFLDERRRKKRREKVQKNFLTPLAIFILGYDKQLNDQREFYSKFYTAPTVQPRIFCRGKKYEIERKHKVKKRDLTSGKLNVCAISCSELSSSDAIDNSMEGDNSTKKHTDKKRQRLYDKVNATDCSSLGNSVACCTIFSMPRKNKRKFFGGKSSKTKSAKLDETKHQENVQQQQNESDSEENNANQRAAKEQEEMTFEVHASTSSVTSDSTLGQFELSSSLPDTSDTKMGGTMSCAPSPSMPARHLRWCSEPNLNDNENSCTNKNVAFRRYGGAAGGNQKATITLKVVQFIGEIPRETRDSDSIAVDVTNSDKKLEELMEYMEGNESMAHDTVQNKFKLKEAGKDEQEEILCVKEKELGNLPKLDHFEEDEANEPQQQQQQQLTKKKRFDDNYRVESPKQISSHVIDDDYEENQRALLSKRHAMLIQEISESSSSEEAKQFLENETCAIDSIKLPIMKIESPREYRVESPESSDECNKTRLQFQQQDNESQSVIVQEIIESSSNESVKNEILHSMSKQQQPSQFVREPTSITNISSSNIINIKELPSENNNDNNSSNNHNNNNEKILTTHGTQSQYQSSATAKIKLFECKSEKKLNKAEEAIIEALYGNSNLLQIPNTPLDVISEEGSDCSDIERHSALKLHESNKNNNLKPGYEDEDEDDDVFVSTDTKKFHRPKRTTLQMTKSQNIVAEQPKLFNTKIIETESNVPESCKKWETRQSDSELQAELVYLTSASSSATDLSERSDSNTDTEEIHEDTSEDTENNSLLENISVPSLSYHVDSNEMQEVIDEERTKHENVIDHDAHSIEIPHQQSSAFDFYYQEINEQKLPDIVEEEDCEEEGAAARSLLDIIQSQQQIEDVNKELHHLVSLGNENERLRKNRNVKSGSSSEVVCDETINLIACGDKKVISDISEKQDINVLKSGTTTPIQTRRKYSSDSSTSSSNSQCTIIRQILPIDNVHALKDLCMESINSSNSSKECEGKITVQKKLNSLSRNAPNIPIINELELHYECDNDDLPHRENAKKSKDKVITILQVPPDMSSCVTNISNSSIQGGSSNVNNDEKDRWLGLQSSQVPNLMVALSPLQKDYMLNIQDSKSSASSTATANADVLLDMHKKFVERRAYHEEEMRRVLDEHISSKNSDNTLRILNVSSGRANVCQLEESNLSNNSDNSRYLNYGNESAIKSIGGDSNNNVYTHKSDLVTSSEKNKIKYRDDVYHSNKMDAIRNLILQESGSATATTTTIDHNEDELKTNKDAFRVKKFELENELKKLDCERKELEEELKNIQSLQHFKREEVLFNQKKLDDGEQSLRETHPESLSTGSPRSSDSNINITINNSKTSNDSLNANMNNKYANDDFNDFINSNEKLHKEIYNEWQDKVYERNERKMHKMLKITSINDLDSRDDDTCSEPPLRQRERAASERIVLLNDEFIAKVKERQKRLSLPLDDNLDASTESLLNDSSENDGILRKRKKKVSRFVDNKENFPAHFREFIEYCEQEIIESKNSVESGESKLKKPLYLGLIGVALCICGLFIGKHFLTTNSKLSP